MSELKSIRIENLRSLTDTGNIKLKPLTVLVGKNSVGKSTFARTFPLLRQTCESQKKSPILWYGRFVDFGDFQTALNKNNQEQGISFSFEFTISYNEYCRIFGSSTLLSKLFDNKTDFNNEENEEITATAKINILNTENPQYTINLELNNDIIEMIIQPKHNKIFTKLNNVIHSINDEDLYSIEQKELIPNIILVPDKLMENENARSKYLKHLSYYISHDNFIFPIFIQDQLNKYYEKDKYNDLTLCIQKYLFKIKDFNIDEFRDFKIEPSEIELLKDIFIISKIDKIINFFNKSISSYFKEVRYLEPLRATAQRYYRKQDLAIDEVDSKGSNIAMYLAEHHQHEVLKKIIKKHFDLEFITESSSGHITLNLLINQNIKEKINLADLGVGYSQLLPVILQLWSSVYNNKNNSQGCLVVEQPELHLHPAYQSKIADVTSDIINSLKERERNYSFIYETHSPHFINRLGELIELEELDKDDVQILIFDNSMYETNIIEANFNKDGTLNNWPFGFFL